MLKDSIYLKCKSIENLNFLFHIYPTINLCLCYSCCIKSWVIICESFMSQIKLKDFVSCLTSQVHRLFKHVQVNEFAVNYPKAAAEIKALEIEGNLRIFFPSS